MDNLNKFLDFCKIVFFDVIDPDEERKKLEFKLEELQSKKNIKILRMG